MMKKTPIMVLMAVLFLAACTGSNQQKEQNEQFKVSVNLINADGEMIYLQKFVDKELVTLDSAIITNDSAVLKADKGDVQDLYAISLKGLDGNVTFFPENSDVTFAGDKTGVEMKPELKASKAQDLLNEYTEQYQDYYVKGYDLYLASMAVGQQDDENVKTKDSISKQLQQIQDEMVKFQDSFIRDHADNFISHYILDENKQDYTPDELREYLALFTTESVFKKDIEEHLAKMDKTSVGSTAPDFTLETYEGKKITLSAVTAANKLTLVDFWASWCGPCRGENPNVKAAYEKYHGKGLEIIGVSLDSDVKAWQKAVADDGLSWIQVMDIDHKAADDYSIYYIPSNFLLDSEGKIVASGLRGVDLEAKLAELLK